MQKFFLPVIVITVLVSFFRLGSVTLFDVDEAIFAEATKEMVQSKDWITPTYNGINRYDKPVLFYWLMAASYKTFGINEFGARFPSALAALMLTLSVFFFTKNICGAKNAVYAAFSLALSMYYLAYSHAAVTDMTLTLFITLSLFSFYLALSSDKKRYLYGFYLFSALAFLTKGLIGILFPFGIALTFLMFSNNLKKIKGAFSLTGIVIFVVASFPWYVAQFAINGSEFIQQFFIKHHFTRYTDVVSSHKGAFYYYIPVLIAGLFPWIAFLPAGIKNAVKEFASISPSAPSPKPLSPYLFSLVWFAFVFIFFSFSTTKLPNYILPSVPAAVLLISSGMASQDRWNSYANLFIACISLLFTTAFMLSPEYLQKYKLTDTAWIYPLAATTMFISLASFWAFFKKKTMQAMLSGGMIIFLLILSLKVLPLANQQLQGTLYKYSQYAKEHLRGRELLTYDIIYPSIVFYSDHRVINIRDKDGLLKQLEITPEGQKYKSGRFLAITKTKDLGVLKDAGFRVLESDEKYALLER